MAIPLVASRLNYRAQVAGKDEALKFDLLSVSDSVLRDGLNGYVKVHPRWKEKIMAAVVGGSLDELAQLKRTLDDQATAVQSVNDTIDKQVTSTTWTGANADRFRSAWAEFKPTLVKLRETLTETSDDIRKQHNALAAATGDTVTI